MDWVFSGSLFSPLHNSKIFNFPLQISNTITSQARFTKHLKNRSGFHYKKQNKGAHLHVRVFSGRKAIASLRPLFTIGIHISTEISMTRHPRHRQF